MKLRDTDKQQWYDVFFKIQISEVKRNMRR